MSLNCQPCLQQRHVAVEKSFRKYVAELQTEVGALRGRFLFARNARGQKWVAFWRNTSTTWPETQVGIMGGSVVRHGNLCVFAFQWWRACCNLHMGDIHAPHNTCRCFVKCMNGQVMNGDVMSKQFMHVSDCNAAQLVTCAFAGISC